MTQGHLPADSFHADSNICPENFPGHGIRRLQQMAVAVFMQESQEQGVTPLQFVVLQKLFETPGIDQRTLAQEVGFDKATIGSVIDRMEVRGLLSRNLTPKDRRVRLLMLTAEGEEMLQVMMPLALQAQQKMLDPLTASERKEFIRLMNRVLGHHSGA